MLGYELLIYEVMPFDVFISICGKKNNKKKKRRKEKRKNKRQIQLISLSCGKTL